MPNVNGWKKIVLFWPMRFVDQSEFSCWLKVLIFSYQLNLKAKIPIGGNLVILIGKPYYLGFLISSIFIINKGKNQLNNRHF